MLRGSIVFGVGLMGEHLCVRHLPCWPFLTNPWTQWIYHVVVNSMSYYLAETNITYVMCIITGHYLD